MSRRVIRGLLVGAFVAARAGAQDSVAHATCRDPHPRPVCGSYFLFEYMGALRAAGTQVTTTVETRDALPSWFAWDVGWMANRSASTTLGASLGIGGNADGTRVSLKARQRRWLDHNLVFDAGAGPLVAAVQNNGVEGQTATYGATADVGFGRARVGLVTLSADVARQRGEMQFATHVGVRTESRGAAIVSAVAAFGVLAFFVGGSGLGGGFSTY
jgi:hypothetical protein